MTQFDGARPFQVEAKDRAETPAIPKAETPQRTFLIDLAANLKGKGYAYGAMPKAQELRELAGLTRDNNTRVIVQAINPDTKMLQRYVMHDGQIDEMKPVKSKGINADIKNLISMAPKDGELSLVIQSHGDGPAGLDGDKGTTNLAKLKQSIQQGLTAVGRDKLDLLSLDSCLMGSAAPVDALSGVARGILASENSEAAGGHGQDGQPLGAIMKGVLAHPTETPTQVAQRFVATSAEVCQTGIAGGAVAECGTDTLFHYNTEAAGQFRTALSNFGNALRASLSDPGNRVAIESAIKATTDASLEGDQSNQLRDLSQFAGNILQAINGDGRIHDTADGALAKAAQGIIDAQKALVDNGFSRLDQHGLSVFLPSEDFSTPQNLATSVVNASIDAARKSTSAILGVADRLAKGEQPGDVMKTAFSEAIQPLDGAAGHLAINKDLGHLLGKIMKGGSEAPLPSEKDMRQLAALLSKAVTDTEKHKSEAIKDALHKAPRILKGMYHDQMSYPQPGWDDFVRELRHLKPEK
jgi:hypothetical protein